METAAPLLAHDTFPAHDCHGWLEPALVLRLCTAGHSSAAGQPWATRGAVRQHALCCGCGGLCVWGGACYGCVGVCWAVATHPTRAEGMLSSTGPWVTLP